MRMFNFEFWCLSVGGDFWFVFQFTYAGVNFNFCFIG